MARIKNESKIPFLDRVKLKRRARHTTTVRGNPNAMAGAFIEVFSEHLEDGIPVDVVCDLVGVSIRTYNHWVRKGEAYEESLIHGTDCDEDKEYHQFLVEVRRAQAIWKKERVLRLNRELTPIWQKELALLERRDRVNWGRDAKETRQEEYSPDDSFL